MSALDDDRDPCEPPAWWEDVIASDPGWPPLADAVVPDHG